MESAAELIVHAAGRHGSQSVERHLERFVAVRARVVTKQEIERRGPGKLRCVAEAAVGRVERAPKNLEGGIERGLVGDAAGLARIGNTFKLCDNVTAGLNDLGALFAPGRGDAIEECGKSGPAVAIVGREVGAPEER